MDSFVTKDATDAKSNYASENNQGPIHNGLNTQPTYAKQSPQSSFHQVNSHLNYSNFPGVSNAQKDFSPKTCYQEQLPAVEDALVPYEPQKVINGKSIEFSDENKNSYLASQLSDDIAQRKNDQAEYHYDYEKGEDEDEDGDDGDDKVQVTIGDIEAEATPHSPISFNISKNGPGGQGAKNGLAKNRTTGLDIDGVGTYDGISLYDLNLDSIEDKPWRKPGADLTDYFNYGFTEMTWKIYCERQKKIMNELVDNCHFSNSKASSHGFGFAQLSSQMESDMINLTSFDENFAYPTMNSGPSGLYSGKIQVICSGTPNVSVITGNRPIDRENFFELPHQPPHPFILPPGPAMLPDFIFPQPQVLPIPPMAPNTFSPMLDEELNFSQGVLKEQERRDEKENICSLKRETSDYKDKGEKAHNEKTCEYYRHDYEHGFKEREREKGREVEEKEGKDKDKDKDKEKDRERERRDDNDGEKLGRKSDRRSDRYELDEQRSGKSSERKRKRTRSAEISRKNLSKNVSNFILP